MMDALRYLTPVNAILAGDIDDAVTLVVACVQAEPDVALSWAWGYARLVDQRIAAIESSADAADLVDVIRDAASFLGAASIDDMGGACEVWEHLTPQRRAEVTYALAAICAWYLRAKANA